jgi:hypothetical protein
MTPLEEAVARIIEPRAFQQLPEPTTPYERRMHPAAVTWLAKCKQEALENARSILALPEIVKMQEALEDIAIYGCGMLNQPIAMNGPEEEWLRRRIREYERRAREAYLALQPLKKEAE